MRRHAGGWDAAPAGGARNPAPGRPRAAVRPYYEGPPSLAGRGADEGGRKPAGSGARLGLRPRPEVTAPGTEKPLWSAERRPRSRKRTRQDGRLVRRLALHPLAFRGARKGPRSAGMELRRTRRRKEYGRWRTRFLIPPLQGERERKSAKHDRREARASGDDAGARRIRRR
jgi:hypothetical protein